MNPEQERGRKQASESGSGTGSRSTNLKHKFNSVAKGDSMNLKGAEEITECGLRRLIVRVSGREKNGKSTWALTAPPPIAYFDLNRRADHVLDRFVGRGVHRYTYDKFLAREQADWKRQWDKFCRDFAEAVGHAEVRSIVIDTDTDLWETRRLAQWGRESSVPDQYGALNKDMRNLYDAVMATDKNLVVVSEMSKKYIKKIVRVRGVEREIGEWDGSYEPKGWGNAGYKVEMNLEINFDPEEKEFTTKVVNCGINALLAGNEYEGLENNFPGVATEVFPDTDMDYWGFDEYVAGLGG